MLIYVKFAVLVLMAEPCISLVLQSHLNVPVQKTTKGGVFSSLKTLSATDASVLDCGVKGSQPKNVSRFAYATLIGGVKANTTSYKGYVMNALIAKRKLRRAGSVADFVVMVEFEDWSKLHVLPEAQLLNDEGIRVVYLPPWNIPSLASGNKFRAVSLHKVDVFCLTEYAAVQFLDADVVPKKNMDYAFNIVQPSGPTQVFGAGVLEPLQAGWFMVSPSSLIHEFLLAQIGKKGLSLNNLNRTDIEIGWGARIPEWSNLQKGKLQKGHNWGFNAAFYDQGFLYYYARFLSSGNAAIFYDDHYETWSNDGTTNSKHTFPEDFNFKRAGFLFQRGDYEHYTGLGKPWLVDPSDKQARDWRHRFWYSELDDLKKTWPKYASFFDVPFPLENPPDGLHGLVSKSIH